MVSYVAAKASLCHRSAAQAVLDRICHESQAPSQPPVAAIPLRKHDGGDEKKERRKKKKKAMTTLGPRSGEHRWGMEDCRQGAHFHSIVVAREAPQRARRRKALARRGTPGVPCLGWRPLRVLASPAWVGVPFVCWPAAKPAPAACRGRAIWPGTDFRAGTGALSAEPPATSDEGPQGQSGSGGRAAPGARPGGSPARLADPLPSGLCCLRAAPENSAFDQKEGPGTQHKHRLQHRYAQAAVKVS